MSKSPHSLHKLNIYHYFLLPFATQSMRNKDTQSGEKHLGLIQRVFGIKVSVKFGHYFLDIAEHWTIYVIYLMHVYLLCWSPHRLQLPVKTKQCHD